MQRSIRLVFFHVATSLTLAGFLALAGCGGDDKPGLSATAPPSGSSSGLTNVPPPPAPPTGHATLSWRPPTTRVDGSPLPAVGGYTIYYGRVASELDQAIHIDGGLTTYRIDNLEQGTWYFAMTATSSDGLESARSATVSKAI